ncbi:pleiotropic drug resistance protein 2-like isoform X2 [Andrographis paniculata]|uniref:pleiotropic drug resistance protein 2-like isoform X2 n=1 Tax=Andrographis paniculata TaxID=175694 RepID=UPI0021E8FA40|nr:pleiotropic drug resistance protein 2-like isoform X2 [Andrographis paniculata]
MASTLTGDDLARLNAGRKSLAKSSGRRSFAEVLQRQSDVFYSFRASVDGEEEEEELRSAAIERLPTYDRNGESTIAKALDDGMVKASEIDVKKLCGKDRKELLEKVFKLVDEDNEKFLQRIKSRAYRVGIEIPKIEVRYEKLSVEGYVHVGSRALPTLLNATINAIEGFLEAIRIVPSKKRKITILNKLSGIVKPSRLTLLLGPPGGGKSSFLLALAGKLDGSLKKSGKIMYCGHEFSEFVPQRTGAYISQHDLHYGEMTVRETLGFSGRCLGVGSRYDMLKELSRREAVAGILPDAELDAFMKSASISGQETSLVTDYILKILGLDICADTMVGDDMRRGISGGQKKRVTTGEMLVGPARALFMDEISTGLDSSTTFQIVKCMRQMVHILDVTMIISLLQPAPETYNLFDDIILLAEGHIVYQGPRETALDFFKGLGFKCPDRKGVADFLQEVTSKKDQEQYWYQKDKPYRYISVQEMAETFKSFHVGKTISEELRIPYDKSKTHPAALVKKTYGIPNRQLFRACFSREWLLMKRNSFLYVFKTVQITIMSIICFTVFFRTQMPYGQLTNGGKYFGALFYSLVNLMFNGMAEQALTVFRLPVFYKQRDYLFYPAWAFALPIWILRIPISLLESTIWIVLTYYTVGFAPSAGRFFRQYLALFSIHQMSLGLFRFIASVGRTQVVTSTLGTFSLLVIFVLGGFIISKNDLEPWMKWAYYISPMSYGQNAIAINEFLDERWNKPMDPNNKLPTVGKILLQERGFYTDEKWFWICVAALLGFSILFNILFIAALTFLNPLTESNTMLEDDDSKNKNNSAKEISLDGSPMHTAPKVMALPFRPLSLVFDNVNYFVDMPAEMKAKGAQDDRLQLLHHVNGTFRPGVLTALVGVSGAGKTTLMDVLAGRKTGGYIEGNINISGYPKKQETFARISGYCEQNDIHSPHVTVFESVLYSAWLRLPKEVEEASRKAFVNEVMALVELTSLRNSLVGIPGVSGLSTEQRKRLTIAVELVANPSIIFMDEPTSGLDARAAAIVMRTVRNTVDTGRTVVCTIHQPSIDIFEAFDELLLLKRGGRVIYAGPIGWRSQNLIEYFEAIPGIRKIEDGYNPATWMLEVTTTAIENQLGVDFADIYANSSLYKRNKDLIEELSTPPPGSKDLSFPTKYSQPFITQFRACFWKQFWSYWRNPKYNAVRFFMTVVIGTMFGIIFWQKGQKTAKQQDLQNLVGAIYSAILFLGATNCDSVQSVVSVEKTVFYRERAAGMYAALSYAIAQVAIEIIYVAIQTLAYDLLLYSMIGFDWKIDKFLWFYYLIFMCFVYFTLFGMMLIAITPGLQFGVVMVGFFLSLWNLFSGFLIPRTKIPIWWRWYYWGSPMAWTIYGLVVCQVGDVTSPMEVTGVGQIPVREFLKQYFGYDHDFLPVIGFMHLVFVVFFALIFAMGIKNLNFQRR